MEIPTSELSFECPRCGEPATGRFYGPCRSCGDALGLAHPGLARDVEAPEYQPKMNVTPNAVATKE